MLGDASRFPDLFTDDVAFSSPHLLAESLESVPRHLRPPPMDAGHVSVGADVLDHA
jgi:hypothetical protein